MSLTLEAKKKLTEWLASLEGQKAEPVIQILTGEANLVRKRAAAGESKRPPIGSSKVDARPSAIGQLPPANLGASSASAPDTGQLTDIAEAQHDRFFPAKIYQTLSRSVVGQERALQLLSVVLFEHMLRKEQVLSPSPRKPLVVLLAGRSGTGKTHMASLAAKFLGVPYVHGNAARLVQSGIIGTSLSDLLRELTASAASAGSDATHGVIFLDEIDKLYIDGEGNRSQHYAKAVQNELLLFLEGEKVRLEKTSYEATLFDTSGLMFVLAGAFDGVEEIVEKRLGRSAAIGFGSLAARDESLRADVYRLVEREDLIKYGFSPQLLGRVTVLIVLNPLGRESILEILSREETSPFVQHRKFFEACGDEFTVDDDVLTFLAEKATGSSMGVRKLSEMINEVLTELKFGTTNHNKEKVQLTRAFVEEKLRALDAPET